MVERPHGVLFLYTASSIALSVIIVNYVQTTLHSGKHRHESQAAVS